MAKQKEYPIVMVGDLEVGYADDDGIVLYMNEDNHIIGTEIKKHKEKIEVEPNDCRFYKFDEDIETDFDNNVSDIVYHYCINKKRKKPYCKLGFDSGYCSYFKKRKDGR